MQLFLTCTLMRFVLFARVVLCMIFQSTKIQIDSVVLFIFCYMCSVLLPCLTISNTFASVVKLVCSFFCNTLIYDLFAVSLFI